MNKKQLSNVVESIIALVILYALAYFVPIFIEWIKKFI